MGASPLLERPGVRDEMRRVEDALRTAVVTSDPFLSEMAGHLVIAGGKRIRPALALAAGAVGSTGSAVAEEVVLGGVAVELVHLGSLYHDDVIDEAATRRGVVSVNARWGNLRAILAGDFLLAKASEIAASLGTEVAALLAATIGRLCEGEVRELQAAFDTGRDEQRYFDAIGGKTASLFATACRIGALVAELPRAQVEALTTYGLRFGLAFQVVDDVLDVVATEAQLGKPAGNDLATGVYTLPVILALASPVGDELAGLLGRPLEADDVDLARRLVRVGGGVDGALDRAAELCDDAAEVLVDLPECAATAALAAAATSLLDTVPRAAA